MVIIVAAGRGERMLASRPKAFLELAGQPLLMHAARIFENVAGIEGVIAVVPLAEEGEARRILSAQGQRSIVVVGGARRQDSVLEGMKAIPEGFDGVVLIHDAARPFVPRALVEDVTRAAGEHGAALPVLPITETVKRVRDGRVIETLNREELAAAQTPQGFRWDVLVRAYEQAFRDQVTVTDEAMAVERMGVSVAAVPGSPLNRKLTTPEDLVWAEACLRHMDEVS
ncbi:MAG: 2-C-methyl-D-erythritol 4-phosphate cytidylyltransferase [Vicinamibacteria bacterium]|jgi:2-C-methyl-D-erythritol 4-phosphate cytidylyltransferase|nr:2-C-methyl-D-erythritol 4-phosphate cytidylyltransferase [Vicinamibacteria bacterium]